MINQNVLRTQISTKTYVRDTSTNQIPPPPNPEEENQTQVQPTTTTDEISAEQLPSSESSTSGNSK